MLLTLSVDQLMGLVKMVEGGCAVAVVADYTAGKELQLMHHP